jgi:riboflavin biosynthesis pyrimidine reductase
MRQIYPGQAALADADLAALYAYPDLAGGRAHWVRGNMVESLDGAATLGGRSRGLSSEWDRQIFAMLRALADVILVGAGTARTERYAPVRPESEGLRWAWLRKGRAPSAPIAVVTRTLDLDLDSALVAAAPEHARSIIITTDSAPAGRRAAAARTADVVVAGDTSVDMAAAVAELAARGLRRILAEGGPHLLTQIVDAGQLDELCLTVSPLLAGPGPDRILCGPPLSGAPTAKPFTVGHVLIDDGYLFCRYGSANQGGRPPGTPRGADGASSASR